MKHIYILLGVLVITAVIVFGFVAFLKNNSAKVANISVVLSIDDNVMGEGGKAILIEYSDFQCLACASYWPSLKQLKAEFGDNLTLVYRHLPLRSIHPNSNIAAQAAEAAGLQGKFWEMADKLFANQNNWNKVNDPSNIFEGYAAELSIDLDKFKNDLISEPVKEKIENNYQEAKTLNLPGTPSFFLNGKKINNPNSYEEFKELIEKELGR